MQPRIDVREFANGLSDLEVAVRDDRRADSASPALAPGIMMQLRRVLASPAVAEAEASLTADVLYEGSLGW